MLTDERQDIKISVVSSFENFFSKPDEQMYMFSYTVTIENKSKFSIQLLSRHWKIFDSQNDFEIVDGEGVIGKQPILEPNESFSYTSGCHLTSDYGKMKGFYVFMNLENRKTFTVNIPEFTLITPAKLN